MAVQPSNACPECKQVPNIPDELIVGRLRSFSGPAVFCNHCDTKLRVAWVPVIVSNPIDAALRERLPLTYAAEQDRLLWYPFTRRAKEAQRNELTVLSWTDADPKRMAFVSYSHKDDAWCHPFAEALKAADFDVFFDNGSIGSGADWVKTIGEGIEACHFFIPVLTPDAWGSEWVQRELNSAFAAHREMIPVLLKDTKVTGILRSVQWLDVRSKTPEQAAQLVAGVMKKA